MKRRQVDRKGFRTHYSADGSRRLTHALGCPPAQALLIFFFVAATVFQQRAEANDVVFEWNANTEPDIAGYILVSGRVSRQYDTWVDVRNVTRYTVSGLAAGTHYFSLMAYDTSGKDSGFSNEISLVVTSGDNRPPVIETVTATGITDSTVTIGWMTDEPGDALVEYGIDATYGSAIAVNAPLTTTHTVGLSGLAASTTYHYRVKSRDAAGNLAVSGDFSFTTAAPRDTQAPIITAVQSMSVSNNSATITWTTNEPGDTQVDYGKSAAYGTSTTLDPALRTSHSQVLDGLTAGTVHHFRVKSSDAAHNQAVSGDFAFTTTSLPDIDSGLVAAYSFDEGAGTTAADSSANSNSAVIANATWTTKAKFGKALSFDGKNSFLTAGVAGLPDLNAPKTISCWLYFMGGAGQSQSVFALANESQQASVRQEFRSSQVGMLQYEGTWLVAASSPSAKNWHHFAYTFDGTENRFYIDGQPISSSTIKPRAARVASFQIGRWITGSEYFKGTVDEVRVYSRALTLEEIRLVMNVPVAASQHTGPVFMQALQNDADTEEESASRVITSANSFVEPSPAPFVNVRLSRDVYTAGETLSAIHLWLGNPSRCARDVEVKVWLTADGGAPAPVSQDTLEGSLTLPAGLNQDFGPVPLCPLDSESLAGSYRLTARIIDQVTGEVLAEDSAPFTVAGQHRITRNRAASLSFAAASAALLEGRFGNLQHADDYGVDGYTIVNNGEEPAAVELKLWMEGPGRGPTRLLALGGEGSLVLPEGSELILDPITAFLGIEDLRPGTYQLRARILDRKTGEALCEDATQLEIP